jgi:hypothetical protein
MKGGAASKTVGARKAEAEAQRMESAGLKRLEEVVAKRKAAEAQRDKDVAENVELKKRLAENKANVELGRAALRDLQAKAN